MTDEPAAASDSMWPAGEDHLPAGALLGAFRIEALLGHGGFAEVYRARRTDAFEQVVAIKVLRLAIRSLLEHFQRERNILATLEHPGIARIIDGGVAPDGRPYMVMEYVEGTDLVTHAANRRLDLSARLTLFSQVCDAVTYAHQHLIVHRDLKPANIRVTPTGRVKLLDFGVAKLLEPQTRDASFETATVLTPEFAAPEQLYGESVTTAADVYALGAVLHQLLCGLPPFDTQGKPLHLAIDELLRSEPLPPSRAAARNPDAPIAPRLLQGDLDVIVQRAMSRKPAERYASVSELALELERHQRHEPVQARIGATTYRLERYLRRHRVGVSFVAVGVLMASGFVLQLYRAQQADHRARLQAEAQQTELQRLATFQGRILTDASVERIGAGFMDALRSQITESAVQLPGELHTAGFDHYLRQIEPADAATQVLRAQLLDPVAARLDAEPDADPQIQARLRDSLARAYEGIGAFSSAAEQWKKAEDLLRAAGAPAADQLPLQLYRLHARAQVEKSEVVMPEYLPLIREIEQSLGADSLLALQARIKYLVLFSESGGSAQAIAFARQLDADAQRILPPADPDRLRAQEQLAYTLCFHGEEHEGTEVARSVLEALERDHVDDAQLQMKTLSTVSYCFSGVGRTEEALAIEQRNAELHRRTLGTQHLRTLSALGNLMYAQKRAGRFAEAEAVGEELITAALQRDTPSMRVYVVPVLINQADIYLSQGKVRAAGDLFDAHLQMAIEAVGATDVRILYLRLQQARQSLDDGHPQRALDQVDALLRDFGASGKRDALNAVHATRAAALHALHRDADAQPIARELYRLASAGSPGPTPVVLLRASLLGEIQCASGQADAGLALLDPLIAGLGDGEDPLHVNRLMAINTAAACELALNRQAAARERLQALLPTVAERYGMRNPVTAEMAWLLIRVQEQPAQRIALEQRWLAWLRQADEMSVPSRLRKIRAQLDSAVVTAKR